MKPTKSIYILLSLFLMFSCDQPPCNDCIEISDKWYSQGDVDVLQDIIDVNESLSGEGPLEIGGQTWNDGRLISLYLPDNQLTSIPESIGNLSSLEKLSLYSNQLTTLPESIGNLSSLIWLGFFDNQLTTLPESIGNLSSLENLYLDSNQLTTLPESICNLPETCNIDFSYNQFCEEYHYDCIDDWGEQDCEE